MYKISKKEFRKPEQWRHVDFIVQIVLTIYINANTDDVMYVALACEPWNTDFCWNCNLQNKQERVQKALAMEACGLQGLPSAVPENRWKGLEYGMVQFSPKYVVQ